MEKLKTAWRRIGESSKTFVMGVIKWETLEEENNLPVEKKKENS